MWPTYVYAAISPFRPQMIATYGISPPKAGDLLYLPIPARFVTNYVISGACACHADDIRRC